MATTETAWQIRGEYLENRCATNAHYAPINWSS
jgi:hypothetical protein